MNDDQYILFTDDGCSACKDAKKHLKKALDSGMIREVKVGSSEGDAIDEQLDLQYVPECVIKGNDGKYRKCDPGTLESIIKKSKPSLSDLEFGKL